MDDRVSGVFEFICHSARLREVRRHNKATAERYESVAEHSWHLALICWLLHDEFERELGSALDQQRMIKMCLMHDLVEIDTGDLSAWDSGDAVARASKPDTENAAARSRFQELPDGLAVEFLALWDEYESAASPEARLVRAVDRLNPALLRYLTGQGWADTGASARELDELQLPRVRESATLTRMYQHVRDSAIEAGLLTE